MELDMNILATFALLVGLELVLGIDNLLLISIITDRVEAPSRNMVRTLGLGLAFFARLGLLLGASYLVKLNDPVIFGFSWKDVILLAGGGFLLFKAVKEIHHVVEKTDAGDSIGSAVKMTVGSAIAQILMLDVVFSVDSVITAVGLTTNLWVIYSSVILSFALVLIFSGPIARFVQAHATLKILALSFLVTIGVTLVMEGLGEHVPKAYIYLPMVFALVVEMLQLRYSKNLSKSKK
jgi:predicted tellurium resistance membrane protein TerC